MMQWVLSLLLAGGPILAAPPDTVDLRVTIGGSAEVVAGEIFDITVNAEIPGPPAATGITMTVTLPEGATYEGPGGGSGPCEGEIGSRVIVCIPDPGSPAEGGRTWELTARAAASLPVGTALNTTVVAASDSTESNPADNTGTLVTTVVARPGTHFTVTGPSEPVVPGEAYRVTVGVHYAEGPPIPELHMFASFDDWYVDARIVNLPEVRCSADPGSVLCETGLRLVAGQDIELVYEFRTSTDPADYRELTFTQTFKSYNFSDDYAVSASTLIRFAKPPAASPSPSVSPSTSATVSPSVSASASPGGGGLPITGTPTGTIMLGGVLLVAAGGGLVLVSRRRRTGWR
ncbi:LPXTG cell wall anchor domain-containing protein [Actinoplanes sp. NBRC 101535]|uniref:LPXTG cell wall anchor domain-containing protein n=1 Tax=Actinoplanes sp. NBRC 101535 TaxID=3032196 RepID=UPI0025555C4E|nr:LPXTG cell wall anchor domain-containing protein [Actinoplanes sp. NBRC 101535]